MKILLKNRNRLGDILVMTCAVRDYKAAFPEDQIQVETPFDGFWLNNPHLNKDTDFIPDKELNIGPAIGVQKSNSWGLHHCNSYRLSIEDRLKIRIPQGPIKPDLHLSKEEEANPIIKGDYWIICPGSNEDFPSKIWPFDRWQSVVNNFKDITFVQIGHSQHYHPPLSGENVINMVGKTDDPYLGLRDLVNIFYHCQGSMGLVSMQMHLAAAFDKPCVIVAGAREPASFEAYNIHRYLHNQGSMTCSKKSACWAKNLGKCKKAGNLIGKTPKCLSMISITDVTGAIRSYYVGGMLKGINQDIKVEITEHPVFKMICNAHGWGGGERSAAWIINRMAEKGYRVHMVPRKEVSNQFRDAIPNIEINNKITQPADITMLYANDMVWDFLKPEFDIFYQLQSKRKVMCVNFRLGKAGQNWSGSWDKYLFLNKQLESEFKDKFFEEQWDTQVLPPPVDLKPFLNGNKPSFNGALKFVRHSSQGDTKYHKNIETVINNFLFYAPNTEFHFMPAPSFLPRMDNVFSYPEYSMDVPEFLSKGNIYWYMLPDKYLDNGPRVIIEAMAMGMPVLADPVGGALDRMNDGFVKNWLNLWDEVFEPILKAGGNINTALKNSGIINRDIAIKTFNPELWIEAIEGVRP